MSFSTQFKAEICQAKRHCPFCVQAMLYGMLLFNSGVTSQKIAFISESKDTANQFAYDLVEITGAIMTVSTIDTRSKRSRFHYMASACDERDILEIQNRFFPKGEPDFKQIRTEWLEQDCCKTAFLRGAFLACGVMMDPHAEYHVEFTLPREELCLPLLELLNGFLELDFRVSTRNQHWIVYLKESQQIEEFLTMLGGVKTAMDFMNLKIEKELRNQVNRAINCETANIGRTINAALEQLQSIQKIVDTAGLESLPIPLREAAELRLAHPEASLRELCEKTNGKISRSGLNHRFQKLCGLAKEDL